MLVTATLLLTLTALVSTFFAAKISLLNRDMSDKLYQRRIASVGEAWSLGDPERMERDLEEALGHSKVPGFEWHFMQQRLQEHSPNESAEVTFPVASVAVSRKHREVIACDDQGHVVIGKLSAGKLGLKSLDGVLASGGLDVSPNGDVVAIAGAASMLHKNDDGGTAVQFYDLQKREFQESLAVGLRIRKLRFAPNNDRIAVSSRDGTIEVYKLGEATPLWRCERSYSSDFTQIEFSTEGRWLLVAGANQKLDVHDATTGDIVCSRTLDERCRAMAISPDGALVATGGTSATQLWKVDSEGTLTSDTLLRSHGFRVAFSPDGKYLAAVDRQAIKVWMIAKGQWRQMTTLLHRRLVGGIVFMNNSTLVSGSEDQSVKVWDVSNSPTSHFVGNRPWYFGLAVASDGLIAASETPNSVTLWHPNRRSVETLTGGHESNVLSLDFTSNGQYLLAADEGGSLKSWSVRIPERPAVEILRTKTAIWSISLDAKDRLILGTANGDVQFANRIGDEPRSLAFADQRTSVYRVRFSNNGKMFAVGGTDEDGGRSEIWEWTGDEPKLLRRHKHGDAVYSLEFVLDDRRLVTATRMSDLEMFETTSRDGIADPIFATTTPPFFIHSMASNPDQSRLLTASPNGQIRFWSINPNGLTNVGRFTLAERVREIEFSTIDSSLITASEEGWTRVWPYGNP